VAGKKCNNYLQPAEIATFISQFGLKKCPDDDDELAVNSGA